MHNDKNMNMSGYSANRSKKQLNPLNSAWDEEDNQVYVYYNNTYIYGWGKNKYGEVGVGNTENILVPK